MSNAAIEVSGLTVRLGGFTALVHKGITRQQVADTVAWARQVGIETTASFMFGLPGEDPAAAQRTIALALELEPDYAQFFTTKMYRADAVPPSLGQRLPEWEYNPHDLYGPPYLPVAYHSLSQLHALRRQAYQRFYLRPAYLRHKLGASARPQDVLRLLQGAGAFLKILRR